MNTLPLPIRILFAFVALTVAVTSCYTNKETGRKQLLLTSRSEESQLGAQAFTQIKQETPVSNDASQTELVRRVGQRISAVVNLPGAQWEFVTFKDDKTVNAFCLPGGKVGVYTGILPITQTEAGLAAVIGHEVAHAVARHGGERMSEGLLVQLGGVGLQIAMRDKPQETVNLALQAYGAGSTLGVVLPHSRGQELEADHLGMKYMAQAGYDPREAVELWKRMKAQAGGGKPPEFLSTHPSDDRRIRELEEYLPEAQKYYHPR